MAKVGAWDVDMRTRQTRWSLEVQTLLGRAEIEEVITSLEAYHPEDRDRVHKLFFDCVLSGAAMDFEARSVNAEGAPIWLHVIGAPEFELGVCTAIRGAIQDITAKKTVMDAGIPVVPGSEGGVSEMAEAKLAAGRFLRDHAMLERVAIIINANRADVDESPNRRTNSSFDRVLCALHGCRKIRRPIRPIRDQRRRMEYDINTGDCGH